MAHLLDFSNDRVNMAYVGRRPWHGLGNELGVDAPLETWRVEAGLAFDYRLSPVRFFVEDDDPASYLGAPATMPNNFVVYRSDTRAPLAVVSNRYHPVQPGQILEFFRELIAQHGFTMETAGSLKGGAVVWALARTGLDLHLGNDVSHQYVLLMTSCDTKLATRATLTAIRVVCWNTLSCALNRAASDLITVRHTQAFDPEDVARNLGLTTHVWDEYADAARAMTKVKLSDMDAKAAIIRIFGDPDREIDDQPSQRAMQAVLKLFQGEAKGAALPSADGTVWGLLNAVTEYVDHHAPERGAGGRLASAWTGVGERTKRKALDDCVAMAA